MDQCLLVIFADASFCLSADSWPSILDEFTEHAGARRKKEGDGMDLS